MGSKKLQVWLPLLFSLVMIVGMVIGFKLKEKTMSAQFFSFSGRSTIQELSDLIRNRYVDKVALDSVNGLVATELLQRLDPHSVYIPADELAAVNEDMAGNFQGIGIEFRILNDTVHVMNVLSGGPADKVGVVTGDQIITVNDSIPVSGVKIDGVGVRKLFRGPSGSAVKVKLKRGALFQQVVITRGVIPVSSIDAAYMIDSSIGYIRINKFAERTYEEFMQSLEQLQKTKMQSLILDLRGNGGGLMKEAVDIADEFLTEDKLIVYTEGEHSARAEYRTKRPGLFETGKLVVLIDETAASASEVLAGALQDWDRATIVGRRSFGKGLVQQQFQLSSGAAVRLTVARYYTPLGRNIQKPYDKGYKAYINELDARYHADTLTTQQRKEAQKVYTTPGGKKVYGGGGITPDSTVKMDSVVFNRDLLRLLMSASVNNAAYKYYLNRKAYFESVTDLRSLVNSYQPSEQEWRLIAEEAAKEGIAVSGLPPAAKMYVLNRFKALIFRQKQRLLGYFMALNTTDPVVKAALVTLK